MMGIAPIFFWFARLCLRLDNVTRCGASGPRMMGQAGLTGRFGTSISERCVVRSLPSIESHYSGLQCIWQI